MPKFQITDQDSGHTMVVEGEQAPTQDEASELFKKFTTGPQLSSKPSVAQQWLQDIAAPPKSVNDLVEKIADPTGIGRAIKRSLPSMFSEEGTYLNPEQPVGLVPKLGKAMSESPLDKVMPEKEITKDDSVGSGMAKEGYNMLTGLAKFVTSPGGATLGVFGEVVGAYSEARAFEKFAGTGEQAILHLAQLARKAAVRKYGQAVSAYFTGAMAEGAAEGAVDLYKNHKQMTWGQTAAALEGIVGSAAFASYLGKQGFTPQASKAQVQDEFTSKTTAPPAIPAAPTAPESEKPQTQPYKPIELTDEQIDKRLAEIDSNRKAGGLGAGKTREEDRLQKLKDSRAKASPPAAEQTLDQARMQHNQAQGYMQELIGGGAPQADIEKVRQKIKDLQDKWGSKLNEDDTTFSMSTEAKTLVKKHSIGVKVTYEDTIPQRGQDEPFASSRSQHFADIGSPAWADPGTGQIVIHSRNYQKWLDSITPERRDQAVKSLMSEEKIHLATSNGDGAKYWNSLSKLERWFTQEKYDPDKQHRGNLDDEAWGKEALRYRMQQLMRITPTEIAQEYGGTRSDMGYSPALRRSKIRALDVMESIVRKARENFKDDTTRIITDRMMENIQAARFAASGSVATNKPEDFADQSVRHSQDLRAQAAHYRKLGLNSEADELESMAKQVDEWSKNETASPRRGKDDKSQMVFEDLSNRTRFESIRANLKDEARRQKMVEIANRQMFKQAQSESGQKPIFEAGGAGRGRPKKTGPSYREEEEMFPKEATLSRPEKTAVDLPGGGTAIRAGKAVSLKPGEAPEELPAVDPEERTLSEGQQPRLPTGVQIESGARKWVNDEFTKASERAGSGKGSKLPGIEEFEKYMGRNFQVKPGQARQFYEDALMDRLEKATGTELQGLLQEAFGPGSIIGRMQVPNALEKVEQGSSARQMGLSIELPLQDWIPVQKHASDKVGPEGPAERAKGRPEITTAEATQLRRQKAIALIFNNSMGVTRASDPSIIARKEILPSEINAGVRFGQGGVESLSSEDEKDPGLEERLYDNSRRSERDKASISRRVLVVRKKSDNSVHQVSVWRNPASKRMFITNPDLPSGEGLRLEDALKRYGLLETYTTDQPTEKFHRRFGSVKDYQE